MIRRNRLLRRFLEKASRRLLEEHVGDPELRAKLTPDYEIGCKRVLISDDFYPALAKPNVELVASAVREVREGGLVAEDGDEREVDTIVFATGFETSNSPILSRIRGREGRSIDEVWNGRPRFHRATTIAGFPTSSTSAARGPAPGTDP
jgi:cation diffusion facilitator CzcD-associated flavoprotein CzcO